MTPGEFESPKPITKAERDARKAFRRIDAETAMTEHEIAQGAFSANRERLKAERLAREAAGCSRERQDHEEGALKIHPLSGCFRARKHRYSAGSTTIR